MKRLRSIFLKSHTHRALIAATAAAIVMPLANAQDAPASSPTATFVHPYQQGVDPKDTEFFIPVVTMEQHYTGPTRLQGYRIQLFRDGRGIYHGLKNVKTLGEVRFNVEPEQVQEILKEFHKYKFWAVPADEYGSPTGQRNGHGLLTLEFTLRDGGKSRTVRFGAQDQALFLQWVIEQRAQSARWRCPFVDDRAADLCATKDRKAARSVRVFIERELPNLQEVYK